MSAKTWKKTVVGAIGAPVDSGMTPIGKTIRTGGEAVITPVTPPGNEATLPVVDPKMTASVMSNSGYVSDSDKIGTGDAFQQGLYEDILARESQNIAEDPARGQAYTQDERDALYIQAGIDPSGTNGYTQEQKAALASGSSGADEDLLSDSDYALIRYYKQLWNEWDEKEKAAAAAADAVGIEEARAQKRAANEAANRIRLAYGYYGGEDGSLYLTAGALGIAQPENYGPFAITGKNGTGPQDVSVNTAGGGLKQSDGGYGGGKYGSLADAVVNTVYDSVANGTVGNGAGNTGGTQPKPEGTAPAPSVPNVGELEKGLRELLDKWQVAAVAQSDARVDKAIKQAVAQLEQALRDAEPQFKEQAESVARDERQAMDNAALYAQLRGDRGGIGQAQYNAIQNTAAGNRLAVQQAQTKLAADTQRQIADLRAQGEFEKADAALAITQEYLARLVSLEQWAADYNLDVEQFNAQLQQWEKEYRLAAEKLAVSQQQWQQEYDYAVSQDQREQLAEMGTALLNAGVMPDGSQLSTMGMSIRQATEYLILRQLEEAEV